MELNRVTLTKSGCRIIDFQICKDEYDDNGKLIENRVPPKDGRKLDKLLGDFIEASSDFDVEYEKSLDNFNKKRVKFARRLADAKLPEEKTQIEQENTAEALEVQEVLENLEQTSGKELVSVDLSDSDLELINKYWNEVKTPRERKVRHQLALVTEALNNPTKLELIDGKYVPKVN